MKYNSSVTADCLIQKALRIAFLNGIPIWNMKATEVQELPTQEVVRVKKKYKYHGMEIFSVGAMAESQVGGPRNNNIVHPKRQCSKFLSCIIRLLSMCWAVKRALDVLLLIEPKTAWKAINS